MIDTLYRIRQKSTGLWYGKKRQYEGDTPWRKRPERFFAKSALMQIIRGAHESFLNDIEIVTYHVEETGTVEANVILNT